MPIAAANLNLVWQQLATPLLGGRASQITAVLFLAIRLTAAKFPSQLDRDWRSPPELSGARLAETLLAMLQSSPLLPKPNASHLFPSSASTQTAAAALPHPQPLPPRRAVLPQLDRTPVARLSQYLGLCGTRWRCSRGETAASESRPSALQPPGRWMLSIPAAHPVLPPPRRAAAVS